MHIPDKSVLMLVDLYSNRKLHDIGITYYSTFCVHLKIVLLGIKNAKEKKIKIIVSALPIPVHLKIVLLGIKNAKEKRIKIIVSALPIPRNYSSRYNESIFKP